MERKSIVKNNKGGGLIIVIGCVALLSMVGAMLLVVTNNNRKMKELERRAQASFYAAESGSETLVSQLEIEAEDALKRAFADMMVQYSVFSTPTERNQRFGEFFSKAFEAEVTQSDAAKVIMSEALGVDPADLDVNIVFGDVDTVPLSADPVTGVQYSEITIKNATFTYSASGTETSVSTDIKVKTVIPNVDGSVSTGVGCDFTDFALIAGKDITTELNTNQTVTVNGNLYTKNSLRHNNELMTLNVNNAKKFLVGKELEINDGATLTVNGGTQASGDGIWADGVTVSDGGKLYADSNFYVSDDLTIDAIEHTGSQVVISGGEYVGYSGGDATVDASAASSAITINTAKDIVLDLSGTTNLILTGRSYIRDRLWAAGGAANALGVLQGESVAYKDMQSMYLVPGECLSTKHNPMTLAEYNAAAAGGSLLTGTDISYKVGYTDQTFSFLEYLDYTTDPMTGDPILTENNYVVRHVKLDGGATEFVYLYINFKDEQLAQKYFKDYMGTDGLSDNIKKRLGNLGASTIKLATNNYTLANAFSYDSAGTGTYGVQEPTTALAYLDGTRVQAMTRTNSMFTYLRKDATATTGRGYDVIANQIIKPEKFNSVPDDTWVKNSYEVGGVTYDFWVYDGDAELTLESPNKDGIILVNGKLSLKKSSMNFSGLILATGGIKADGTEKDPSQTNAVEIYSSGILTSNKTAVEALLTVPEVQEYFRATSGSGGAPGTPWLSSEAVSISFENWQKNE